MSELADIFVAKQLATDRDTGIKHIMKTLKLKNRDVKINYSVFQRVFCRSIFKESLTEVLKEIESQQYKTNGQGEQKKKPALKPSKTLASK